jgi:hypothetical protein
VSRRDMVWRLTGLEGPDGARSSVSSSSSSSMIQVGRRWCDGAGAVSRTGTDALGTRMLLGPPLSLGDRCGVLAGAVVSDAVSEVVELGACGRCRRECFLCNALAFGASSEDDSTMSTSISPWRFERGDARECGSPLRDQSFAGRVFNLPVTFLRREVLGPPCCCSASAIRPAFSPAVAAAFEFEYDKTRGGCGISLAIFPRAQEV